MGSRPEHHDCRQVWPKPRTCHHRPAASRVESGLVLLGGGPGSQSYAALTPAMRGTISQPLPPPSNSMPFAAVDEPRTVSNRGPVRVVEKARFLPTLQIPTREAPDDGAVGMLNARTECCPCPWPPAHKQASAPRRKELCGEQPPRELWPAHHCPSMGGKWGAWRFPEQGSACLCTMRPFPPLKTRHAAAWKGSRQQRQSPFWTCASRPE